MSELSGRHEFRIPAAFWLLGAMLGFAQAWLSRMDIVNDTISYLDMGNYFFHGHREAIINGLWGPFYAWLLGLTLYLSHPSARWEYPVIHLLLYVIFLFTIACFEYFLRQLTQAAIQASDNRQLPVPEWAWTTIAYTTFCWASIALIGVSETNPDMLVAAFFYLACGLVLKIWSRQATAWTVLALGLVLGLSYTTKFVMLPVSLFLLAAAWMVGRRHRWALLAATVLFLGIAGSFITALSWKEGRFSTGESGPYNYEVHVNGIPYSHWQGDLATGSIPVHPTHQIFHNPDTFEFARPLAGTYPVWYDPSYWYQGIRPRLHWREQAVLLVRNAVDETGLFSALCGAPFAGLFLLYYIGGRQWLVVRDMLRYWFLVLPSVAALGLYALVHYETRYVSPFFVVLLMCMFASVLPLQDAGSRRIWCGLAVLQTVILLSPFGWPDGFYSMRPLYKAAYATANAKSTYPEVAAAALQMGLKPGDRIASLDYSNIDTAMWAYLDQLQVDAEVYYWPAHPETQTNNFWSADLATERSVLAVLSRSGARAVISDSPPTGVTAGEWQEIGGSHYYLHWLTAPPVPPSGPETR